MPQTPVLGIDSDTAEPTEAMLRSFDDAGGLRDNINSAVLAGLGERFPIENDRYRLELGDLKFEQQKYKLAEQKRAILEGRSLSTPVKGTWSLFDKETNQQVDKTRGVVLRIPYVNRQGTYIYNGNQYTISNQARLRAGIYTRQRESGEVESHFNVQPGTGIGFRIMLEPQTGVFKLNVGQASLKLLPVLRGMGLNDADVRRAWGNELFEANASKDDPSAFKKAAQRLVSARAKESVGEGTESLALALAQARLDPNVTMRTLGQPYDKVDLSAIVDATRKMISVSRGEAEVDDRDSMEFQEVRDASDLFKERITRDAGMSLRRLLWKITNKGNLSPVRAGILDDQMEGALYASGLGNPLEEINPIEVLDKTLRITKLGEGGVSSIDSVPDSSREVQPSQFGVIDPIQTPECYDDQTEVMTEQGWKYWPAVDSLDKFACLVDGKLEFHASERLVEQPYNGLMYGCNSRFVKYFVTSNHRMWVRPQGNKGKEYHPEYRYQSPEEISNKLRLFRSGGHGAVQGNMDSFLLPKVTSSSNNLNDPVQAIIISDWCAFMGWWLSEGSLNIQPDKGYYSTRLHQSKIVNLENVNAIKCLLNRLPFAWSYHEDTGAFAISGKQLATYLQQFGLSRDKFIPTEVFEANEAARRSFVDTLLAGDGRKDKNGSRQLTTYSHRLAEDYAKLLFQLGYATSITEEPDSRYEDDEHTAYVVRRLAFQEHLATAKSVRHPGGQFYTEEYSGKVYCATVPGGLLYVRRGNTTGFWCGNSEKVGIDLRTAVGTYKGSDGQIYSNVMNARTGEEKPVSARNLAQSVIAFPGELSKKGAGKVRAMVKGKLGLVPREDVDYELPHPSEMFGAASNLVPLISAIKGQRLSMGARMATQALPLRDAESPMVQSSDRYGVSFEERYGKQAGALRSDRDARVVEVVPGSHITLRGADGKEEQMELFDNFPYNRKTYVHNTPMVRPGDMVKPGQLLAKSNFTDDKGRLALGKNFRVAYIPFKTNFEYAIVISESAAQRLSSEHMYPNELELDDKIRTGKDEYIANFPTVYSNEQLKALDRDGVVKPGAKVKKGDPLALAFGFREPRPGDKLFKRKTSDKTMTWDHAHEGEVTDVVKTKNGHRVFVKAYAPMEVGDKMSGRYGDKGIIAQIVPDGEMPQDGEGRPIEVALNPLGIVSRGNPAQIFEAALGKIAEKRGEAYNLPAFRDGSLVDFVEEELKKYNVKDTEDLTDPTTGRKLKNVFTGNRFMMKLHHTAESKESGRETGAYTMDLAPAKGKVGQAKRIGGMELSALVSHGASEVIRDAKLIRGQRNDEFWQAFRLGYAPPMPRIPHAYERFVASLQAAGVNVQKEGNATNIMALTNKDVDKLSGGELQNADTVNFETMEPVPGGLFDRKLFGGHNGRAWAHITLAEPMPNPVMEEPVRRLLGLTKKQFRSVLTGEEQLNGKTGGYAILDALSGINVDEAIKTQRSVFQSGRKSYRDDAAKRLGYLKNFKSQGISPADMMLTRVPVLPTLFRPVSKFRRMQIMADANLLYKDLFEANDAYKGLEAKLGRDHTGEERLAVYDAFKAVAGLGDPIKAETEQKQAKGLLKQIFGGSPKYGYFQSRVMASPMDMVGRAVVTPDAGIDMDHVGLPEDKAWEIYKPFTIRRLVRTGVPPTQAVRMVADQDDRAKRAMQEEMNVRPVLLNRNPTLHKYGIMASFPVMVKDKTLHVSPTVVGGFGMDFDGDAAQYHVPVTESARKEAIERMLPSKNLLSQQDFDVHYVPKNEFALGLYLASALKAKRERTFADKEAVVNAFKRGEIDAGTVISIPGSRE